MAKSYCTTKRSASQPPILLGLLAASNQKSHGNLAGKVKKLLPDLYYEESNTTTVWPVKARVYEIESIERGGGYLLFPYYGLVASDPAYRVITIGRKAFDEIAGLITTKDIRNLLTLFTQNEAVYNANRDSLKKYIYLPEHGEKTRRSLISCSTDKFRNVLLSRYPHLADQYSILKQQNADEVYAIDLPIFKSRDRFSPYAQYEKPHNSREKTVRVITNRVERWGETEIPLKDSTVDIPDGNLYVASNRMPSLEKLYNSGVNLDHFFSNVPALTVEASTDLLVEVFNFERVR